MYCHVDTLVDSMPRFEPPLNRSRNLVSNLQVLLQKRQREDVTIPPVPLTGSMKNVALPSHRHRPNTKLPTLRKEEKLCSLEKTWLSDCNLSQSHPLTGSPGSSSLGWFWSCLWTLQLLSFFKLTFFFQDLTVSLKTGGNMFCQCIDHNCTAMLVFATHPVICPLVIWGHWIMWMCFCQQLAPSHQQLETC